MKLSRYNCFVSLIIVLLLFLFASCQSTPSKKSQSEPKEHNSVTENDDELTLYRGKWEGQSDFSNWILNVNLETDTPYVLFSDEEYGFYFAPMDWEISENQLVLTMNDEIHRATFILRTRDGESLTGNYEQYDVTSTGSFTKISENPENKEYYKEYDDEAKMRINLLKEFHEYEDDETIIPFTYTLHQKEENQQVIDTYDLDSLTGGYADVELMEILLNWVCDTVRHDGSVGLPEDRDIGSLIQHAQENNGINCRGVSIILADLCRIYGIEAKHITCMPKEVDFDECHVVVQAYSDELDQWVMLDPTYRLILKTDTGQYVNLQMLRQSFLDDTVLTPNDNAGWNGGLFDVHEYQSYMSKNLFRFSCATDFYSEAEDGRYGNKRNTLIPINYSADEADVITTSEATFWAVPENY